MNMTNIMFTLLRSRINGIIRWSESKPIHLLITTKNLNHSG